MSGVVAKFEPKSDITAYELAQIVAHLPGTATRSPRHGIVFAEEQWLMLPLGIKRHFKANEGQSSGR